MHLPSACVERGNGEALGHARQKTFLVVESIWPPGPGKRFSWLMMLAKTNSRKRRGKFGAPKQRQVVMAQKKNWRVAQENSTSACERSRLSYCRVLVSEVMGCQEKGEGETCLHWRKVTILMLRWHPAHGWIDRWRRCGTIRCTSRT